MSGPVITESGKVSNVLPPDKPSHGEFVLHCGGGHMMKAKKHVFYAEVPMVYHIEGVEKKTHWALVCDDCLREAGGEPAKVKLRGVGQYAEPGRPMVPAPVPPQVKKGSA